MLLRFAKSYILLHVERYIGNVILNIILGEFPCKYFAFVYLQPPSISNLHISIISFINMKIKKKTVIIYFENNNED